MSHSRDWGRFLRLAAIALIWVISSATLLAVFTVGRCDSFGGSCPADPQPLLQNDNFVMAATATFAAVAGAVFLSAPSWRRVAWAVGVGLGPGLLVGWWATTI